MLFNYHSKNDQSIQNHQLSRTSYIQSLKKYVNMNTISSKGGSKDDF